MPQAGEKQNVNIWQIYRNWFDINHISAAYAQSGLSMTSPSTRDTYARPVCWNLGTIILNKLNKDNDTTYMDMTWKSCTQEDVKKQSQWYKHGQPVCKSLGNIILNLREL